MKKLSLAMAALLFTTPAWAAVRITVVPEGKTATVKYTTDKKVRAFALDITADKGVIEKISGFIRGESTKEQPGYGIFPGNFARCILVDSDTGAVATWDVNEYTPVAPSSDPGALGGLGTSGITIEMGALYYPTDDSSPNAPSNEGTLFTLTLSEAAKLTVKANDIRGGVVLTTGERVPIEVVEAGAVAATGSITALASADPDYAEWVAVGKPACWTFPRQCHGDADGVQEGDAKKGFYSVGMNDLSILTAAWMKSDLSSIPNGICADFAHDRGGDVKNGFYRVGPTDLNILVYYWMKPDAEVPANCGKTLK